MDMKVATPAVAAGTLPPVCQTLMGTLIVRSLASVRQVHRDCHDPAAERLCEKLGVDPAPCGATPSMVEGVAARGAWFDARCLAALDRHANPLFVSLGSGLDTMYVTRESGVGIAIFGLLHRLSTFRQFCGCAHAALA